MNNNDKYNQRGSLPNPYDQINKPYPMGQQRGQRGGDPTIDKDVEDAEKLENRFFKEYGPKALEELFRRNLVSTNSASPPEIRVNFEELTNVQVYDTIVETFLFDKSICDNRSKIATGISDQIVDSVSRFILTAYAKNVHGVNWDVSAEWSLNQCRDFYIENRGWIHPVSGFMNEMTVHDNFVVETAMIGIKRWESKMSFTDYKTRVFMSIEGWASRREKVVIEVVKEIQVARELQGKLEEDKETISKIETLSPATKTLVNRLNPDLTTLLKLSKQED